jgi:hypothetical protein
MQMHGGTRILGGMTNLKYIYIYKMGVKINFGVHFINIHKI